MSKKIKLSLLIIFILLGIGTTVHAYSPSGYFPQTTSSYIYFCKQKGGALRFFSESLTTDATLNYTSIEVRNTSTMTEYYEKLDEIIESKKNELMNRVEQLGLNVQAYKIPSSNFNGNFASNPR